MLDEVSLAFKEAGRADIVLATRYVVDSARFHLFELRIVSCVHVIDPIVRALKVSIALNWVGLVHLVRCASRLIARLPRATFVIVNGRTLVILTRAQSKRFSSRWEVTGLRKLFLDAQVALWHVLVCRQV